MSRRAPDTYRVRMTIELQALEPSVPNDPPMVKWLHAAVSGKDNKPDDPHVLYQVAKAMKGLFDDYDMRLRLKEEGRLCELCGEQAVYKSGDGYYDCGRHSR